LTANFVIKAQDSPGRALAGRIEIVGRPWAVVPLA